MFGPEGSGKTTLLYKLKLPGWDDIKRDITALRQSSSSANERPKDPGYHYEEIEYSKFRYGIWDVPGSDAFIRMWPMFYRYVNASAILYVVDASEKGAADANKVAQARRLLRYLLNEDELRVAAFFLILNIRQQEPDAEKTKGAKKASAGVDPDYDPKAAVETMKEMLQVSTIEAEPWNSIRFKVFCFDCAQVNTRDKNWEEMLQTMYKVYLALGHGS
jgi:signal recognition particle receptor subunit beta